MYTFLTLGGCLVVNSSPPPPYFRAFSPVSAPATATAAGIPHYDLFGSHTAFFELVICAVRAFDHAWGVTESQTADFDKVLTGVVARAMRWLEKGPREVEELREIAAAAAGE